MNFDQTLARGGDFSLLRGRILLALAEFRVFALERRQVNRRRQIGVEQSLPLPRETLVHAAQRCLPAPQLVRQPGATVRSFQLLRDHLGLLEDAAQISPHQIIELRSRDEPRRAALSPARHRRRLLAHADVIAIVFILARSLPSGAVQAT